MSVTWTGYNDAVKNVSGGWKRALKQLPDATGNGLVRFICPGSTTTSKGDTIYVVIAVTDEQILRGVSAMFLMNSGDAKSRRHPHAVAVTARPDGRCDVTIADLGAAVVLTEGDARYLEELLDPKTVSHG